MLEKAKLYSKKVKFGEEVRKKFIPKTEENISPSPYTLELEKKKNYEEKIQNKIEKNRSLPKLFLEPRSVVHDEIPSVWQVRRDLHQMV